MAFSEGMKANKKLKEKPWKLNNSQNIVYSRKKREQMPFTPQSAIVYELE